MWRRAEEVLDSFSSYSWLRPEDRRTLEQALLEWKPELLRQLSWMSPEAVPIHRSGRRLELYERTVTYRVASDHPGNPTGNSLYVDTSRRFVFASNIRLSNPLLHGMLVDRLQTFAESLDLRDANSLPFPVLDIERWFRNYGHVLDEWFTISALARVVQPALNYIPVYDFTSSWDPTLSAKLEAAAAAIFRGAAINLSEFGSTVFRVPGCILVRHHTADPDFLRFHRGIAEQVRAFYERQETTDAPSFGPRVFLTRSTPPNPTDAVTNLRGLSDLAAQAGFTVVNPEFIDYGKLVRGMRDASAIIATWGSGLTICAYARPGASVLALRAGRYLNEPQQLIWGNLIDEHSLNFCAIDAAAGVIDPNDFRTAVASHLHVSV